MECLARRKLADYLVVALLRLFSPFFSVMTCLSSQSAALTSIAHLAWGEVICTVRTVSFRLFIPYCCTHCTYGYCDVFVRFMLYVWVFFVSGLSVRTAIMHLRLYVWLSFACISVFFVGGLSVRTVTVHF